MSSITYRYDQKYKFTKKGIQNLISEKVIDGTEGLTIVHTVIKGDEYNKMYIKEISKDKFKLVETVGDKDTEKEINSKDLIKLLKQHKLETIAEYVSKDRGTFKGKKVSKKLLKISGYE
jgi:hypothetical protein